MQYMIPQIAAITIIVNGRRTADGWQIMLDRQDPSCRYMVERTLQDDCPIFYQAIAALGDLGMTADKKDQNALSEVFVYIDFQNIFGMTSNKKRLELAEMTESFFRPEGLVINFGRGDNRYVAFERSANMSRDCRLAFVREDVYAPLKERMQLGMEIGECQLSKLYAYNGLMFTTGERVEYEDFSYKDNIIVIDNPVYVVKNVDQVTVADDGSDGPMRTYHRVEQTADIEVMGFDGEGLISPYAAKVLNIHGEHHHSFQIRLPYIKGMVHEVDFEGLLQELGVTHIVDCWGERHPVGLVHIILTKSMFKGCGWMEQNGLSWEEYRQRWTQYDHGLYVSGADKAGEQGSVYFNYQFLNTLQMDAEAFRPLDLPLGWKKSPRTDPRTWLTKTTETAYYDLVADPDARKKFFLSRISDESWADRDPRNTRFKLIRQNERFIDEPCFTKELSMQAKSLLRHYSLGQLLVSGDNRYLSDDLMRLLLHMVEASVGRTAAYNAIQRECLQGDTIYAPAPAYPVQERYLLLRSPHIARNEEVSAAPLKDVGPMRERYLSHLRYVVMIDSRSLIAERLGGADYDGDYVKTIAEPLLVNCIDPENHLPVLKIPAAKPLYADANDWQARMETVKSTFSSRVGQVSNEALRRGLIAYDETDEGDLQEEYALDTELLAILIGLEIDSSKSGVKPDLRDYLGFNKVIAYHGYQSFKTGEVTPEEAHQIGLETARRMWGKDFQVLVTTHLNTDNLHCHFVVNSVSFRDGHKFRNSIEQHRELREISDAVCKEHGLSVLRDAPFYSSQSKGAYWKEQKGQPTHRQQLKEDVEYCLRYSTDWPSFIQQLEAKGYTFDLTRFSVKASGWQRAVRLDRLGFADEYLYEQWDRNEADPEFEYRYNDDAEDQQPF